MLVAEFSVTHLQHSNDKFALLSALKFSEITVIIYFVIIFLVFVFEGIV